MIRSLHGNDTNYPSLQIHTFSIHNISQHCFHRQNYMNMLRNVSKFHITILLLFKCEMGVCLLCMKKLASTLSGRCSGHQAVEMGYWLLNLVRKGLQARCFVSRVSSTQGKYEHQYHIPNCLYGMMGLNLYNQW